jgi:hypothetical protein
VLEFEVVTPQGEIVTANPDSHPDLFWALRGGGGSTFGVITRVTYKAHPRPRFVPCTLTFGPTWTGADLDYDSYYRALAWYYTLAPSFNDFEIGGYPVASKFGFTGLFVASNHSPGEVQAFIDPIATHMKETWNVTLNYLALPEFILEDVVWPTLTLGGLEEPPGRFWVPMISRLISRSSMNSSNMPEVFKFVKITLDDGATHMAYPNMPGAAKRDRKWDFALNPAWKDTSQHFIVTNWHWYAMEDIRNLYQRMEKKYIPLLDRFSQNHGAYINEVRFVLPPHGFAY